MEKETYILSNSYFGKYYWALNYFPNAGIYQDGEANFNISSELLISGAILRLLKCNTYTVEKDDRSYVVGADNRICAIDKDNRIYVVTCSNT